MKLFAELERCARSQDNHPDWSGRLMTCSTWRDADVPAHPANGGCRAINLRCRQQQSVVCRSTRTVAERLHDSWNWTSGKQLLATGSLRCTAAAGGAKLASSRGSSPGTARKNLNDRSEPCCCTSICAIDLGIFVVEPQSARMLFAKDVALERNCAFAHLPIN